MPRHTERRLSAHSPPQLFDLVIDVENYPEFLPWCLDAVITARHEAGFDADLAIGYRMLRARYRSRITYRRPSSIEVQQVRGPFRHLTNQWRFRELAAGSTEIAFLVDFEFRSSMLSKAMTPLFGTVVERMVQEFEGRAEALYPRAFGPPGSVRRSLPSGAVG